MDAHEGVGIGAVAVGSVRFLFAHFFGNLLFGNGLLALDQTSAAGFAVLLAVGPRCAAAGAGWIINDLFPLDHLFGFAAGEIRRTGIQFPYYRTIAAMGSPNVIGMTSIERNADNMSLTQEPKESGSV